MPNGTASTTAKFIDVAKTRGVYSLSVSGAGDGYCSVDARDGINIEYSTTLPMVIAQQRALLPPQLPPIKGRGPLPSAVRIPPFIRTVAIFA